MTEIELVSLYARFQSEGKPKLLFKLLNGTMRGRAFITFPGKVACAFFWFVWFPYFAVVDVEGASEALQFSHGFLMRPAQPLIVAFGKSILNK